VGAAGVQVLPLLAAQGGFVNLVPREAGHHACGDHVMCLAEKRAHGVLEVSP
jgi:nitrite reductase (NO-forming)